MNSFSDACKPGVQPAELSQEQMWVSLINRQLLLHKARVLTSKPPSHPSTGRQSTCTNINDLGRHKNKICSCRDSSIIAPIFYWIVITRSKRCDNVLWEGSVWAHKISSHTNFTSSDSMGLQTPSGSRRCITLKLLHSSVFEMGI